MHPRVRVYDGFLLHSRSAGAAPLAVEHQGVIAGEDPVRIRTDLDEPMIRFMRCRNCGVQTHWEPLDEPPHARMGINANLIDPAALEGVPQVEVDGASW